jgi:hypothetical protein
MPDVGARLQPAQKWVQVYLPERGCRFICPNVGAGFQPAQKWVQVFNLHKNHAGRGLTAG